MLEYLGSKLTPDNRSYVIRNHKLCSFDAELGLIAGLTLPASWNVVAVSSGYNHALLLLDSGEVYAHGTNFDGQLGLGDIASAYGLYRVHLDEKVVAINTGFYCSYLLTVDGQIYATGYNIAGQLRLGDYQDRRFFTLVTSVKWRDVIHHGKFEL